MDVIVDIDGTLAEISHRRHYVASKPKNWKAFNASMHLDEPNTPVIEVVRALWTLPLVDEYGPETRILLASGRGEEFRGVTEDWLLKNRIFPENKDPNYIYPEYPVFTYEKLYMRPEKDSRSDVIVKREILDQMRADGFDPTLAIDDRCGVVAMWREAGLTCLQCAPGQF
jgi:hypothetical protein